MFDSLLNRHITDLQWQKIPWHDPEFSRRMLREHLSQEHDAASRRKELIQRHLHWIHHDVLQGRPSKVLDLGCGPGFYTGGLTDLGHDCKGVDISPASIEYAQQNQSGQYQLGDIRTVEYGRDYDLILLIFGEFNAFALEDAQRIVSKAHDALKPGGQFLLEVHPYELVQRVGSQPASWYTSQAGLFSDEPCICLQESFFIDDRAETHHYIIDAQSGAMSQYTNMLQAYTDAQYRALFSGFATYSTVISLDGKEKSDDLFVILAQKDR